MDASRAKLKNDLLPLLDQVESKARDLGWQVQSALAVVNARAIKTGLLDESEGEEEEMQVYNGFSTSDDVVQLTGEMDRMLRGICLREEANLLRVKKLCAIATEKEENTCYAVINRLRSTVVNILFKENVVYTPVVATPASP